MTRHDCRGNAVTAAHDDAVRGFDAAVEAFLGFRKDTGDRLKAALVADPVFPLGHCLKGYFMLLFGQRSFVPRAKKALQAAEVARGDAGCTPREAAHLDALSIWCAGDLVGAVERWEKILLDHPRDILALKLAQYGTFYLGDSEGLRDSIGRVMHAWDDGVPGHGFVLGMYAFGLEESGDYAAAERLGRRAIELHRPDIWAAHAVAHVMEMQGRPREGVAWIGDLAGEWRECNNFAYHPLWHRCLFHLELGDHDRVLALYDAEVRPDSSDDLLDISNAVALLWRLEEAGVDVGARWEELAERSEGHVGDHALVFGDAHYAMALARFDRAGAFLDSARGFAASGDGTEAAIMQEIGLPLLEAILAHRSGAYGRAVDLLLPIRRAVRRIGGSHAQRDLFQQLLIDSAIRAGRLTLARALLSERLQLRPRNAWAWRHYARVLEALGDFGGAEAARGEGDRVLA